jgi:2'-5' RNA ligase
VAVPCGERLRSALTTRLDALPEDLPVRWTQPQQWHLTLQFLGDWPESRLPGLIEALSEASDRDSFTLLPGGLGAFPSLRQPRVLFLQMEDDGAAAGLAKTVREEVAGFWPVGPQDGGSSRKVFRPHLTLSRIRRPLSPAQVKRLEDIDLSGLPDLPVTGFTLFSSVLDRGGARHTPVAEFALRKKGEK